ncbi:MAG: 2-oxo acid dehydrogenase subunit E2 [Chloroflexi bacterium]|nr:2-oxo acid dehydrogenase subunit E2 [Chloroflexota bacterium]
MPKLGFDMTEGSVQKWLKAEGDSVQKGEPIAEIETDKATVEFEAPNSGVLQKIILPEGKTVPVGDVIAILGEVGEAPAAKQENGQQPAKTIQAPATEQSIPRPQAVEKPPAKEEAEEGELTPLRRGPDKSPSRPAAKAPTRTEAPAGGTDGGAQDRVKASPLARAIARELNIDLTAVPGNGPGGRVEKKDVELYAEKMKSQAATAAAAPAQTTPVMAPARQPAPAPAAEGQLQEFSKMRQAISRRMTESKQTVPHIYITSEVDMTDAVALRRQINETMAEDSRISVNDFVIKAVARALESFPNLNASYQEGKLRMNAQINIGVAVSLDNGLITTVLHQANTKSLGQISREVKQLVKRARENKFRPDDLQGATFTISNLGMYDVEEFVAIINPPEAGILAVGSAHPKPVVVDGQVVVRERMRITISADHRVSDGAEAARFLQEVKKQLQNPMVLVVG